MPRNAGGVYTLPDPPVVGGTIIEALDENTTRDDLGNEITNSLDRNGRGGMLAPFKIADGLVSTPGLSFINDPANGIYRVSMNTWGLVSSGVNNLQISSGLVTVPATINLVISGTISGTGFATAGDVRWLQKSIYASKGILITGTDVSPGDVQALLPGANGDVLQSDNTVSLGIKWGPPAAVSVDVPRTWTTPQRDANSASAAGSFNMNLQNDFTCTPVGAIVLTFTNITLGQRGMISFSNTANFAVTFAAAVRKGSTAGVDLSLTGLRDIAYWSPDGVTVHIGYSDILT